MSGQDKLKHKFKFKLYDDDGNPIIKDNGNNVISEHPEGPGDLGDRKPLMEVYSVNPTWIKIGGRWYCIGC